LEMLFLNLLKFSSSLDKGHHDRDDV